MPEIGILGLAQQEVPDLTVAEAGEYQLEITGYKLDEDKNGVPYISVFMNILDRPNSKMVSHFISLPREEHKEIIGENRYNESVRRVQAFVSAFEIASDDPETWKGKTCFANLKVKADDEYGDQNQVKSWTVSQR